jgi:hypothetical protein
MVLGMGLNALGQDTPSQAFYDYKLAKLARAGLSKVVTVKKVSELSSPQDRASFCLKLGGVIAHTEEISEIQRAGASYDHDGSSVFKALGFDSLEEPLANVLELKNDGGDPRKVRRLKTRKAVAAYLSAIASELADAICGKQKVIGLTDEQLAFQTEQINVLALALGQAKSPFLAPANGSDLVASDFENTDP